MEKAKKYCIIFVVVSLIASLVLMQVMSTHDTKEERKEAGAQGLKEVTFAMIKPDAVRAKNSGKIIDVIEHNDFTILRLQKRHISKEMAETFYAVHKERPFFQKLVEFITSGPVIVMALEKENAIKEWRDLMGATDPGKAAPGTIRKLFGTNISFNAVHGSDAPETAASELLLFFGILSPEQEKKSAGIDSN